METDISMREAVRKLRNIKDVNIFKETLKDVIENNIKIENPVVTLINWVDFLKRLNELYEEMSEVNKDTEKLGVTMVCKENSLVFMLKYKLNSEFRSTEAIIGYGENERYSLDIIGEVVRSGLESRLLGLFDKLNELHPSEKHIAFNNNKEILEFLNAVDVWSELEQEKGLCNVFIVEYPCEEGCCCVGEDLFDTGLVLANNKYKYGKEYELLRYIGMGVARHGEHTFPVYSGMQKAMIEGYGSGIARLTLMKANLEHLDMARYYTYYRY